MQTCTWSGTKSRLIFCNLPCSLIYRVTTWIKNVTLQDLAWNKQAEVILKDLYIEAQSSNKYTNLIDEDRDYLIKKLKKLDNIVDMTEVSSLC